MKNNHSILLLAGAAVLLTGCLPALSSTPTTTPTRMPVETETPTVVSFLWATPTVAAGLLRPAPGGVDSPPAGLAVDVYQMARGPFPDEGYDPVIRALGEESRLRSMTQGRYAWDTADLARMEANNAALAPFGYRLDSKPVNANSGARWYVLSRGDEVILDPVTGMGRVLVNRSGTDFLLTVEGTDRAYLASAGSLEPLRLTYGAIRNSSPQFLGDDVMRVEVEDDAQAGENGKMQSTVAVLRNEQGIYSQRFESLAAAPGFIGFWTYGEHWALETVDSVVIDGQAVNAVEGCDRSYEFHLLGGRPLYFFEKAGEVRLSFDGESAALPFTSVPHYGCCSASLDNPKEIGDVLVFYGMRGEDWYYVEAAGG